VKIELETLFNGTGEEWYAAQRWENKSPGQQAGETGEAWDRWVIASCEERGGHWWQLDWDADDGLDLQCRYCPAGINDLYPDGGDLISAELPLPAGKVLKIEYGGIPLGAEPPCQSWSGPVRAWVETKYRPGGPWGGPEWDAWVIVEAA
jgi:hypothetical protein